MKKIQPKKLLFEKSINKTLNQRINWKKNLKLKENK